MNFSTRLTQLRKENNITQTELAKLFNVSQSTVGMWETGKRDPNSDDIVAIAKYFDVTTDYLLGKSNNPKGDIVEKEDNIPPTIAAHFDGDGDLTEEEVNQINKFIEFVKQQKELDK